MIFKRRILELYGDNLLREFIKKNELRLLKKIIRYKGLTACYNKFYDY